MTQDWSKMLKSFRTKTYRNLQEDQQQQQRTYQSITSADNLLVTRESEPTKEKGSWSPEEILEDSASDSRTSSNNRSQYHFAIRGRSASEPSFLSVNRAVKVPQRYSPTGASVAVSSSSNHNSTPPTVKEISSITGLQQQIKAAFGRWRKRGGQSSSTSTSPQYAGSEEEEALSESAKQQIREDSFDHPLNIRVSPSSQTFSHPHRLTVFPPFPGPPSPGQTPQTSGSNNNNNKSSGNPFAFVRGLRNKRRGDSNPASSDFASSSSCGGRTERTTADGGGWSSRSVQSDFGSSFPLVTKSRSDHSLHRILKDDHNAWTVFATLRSPHEKGDTKGSTAWTFGLFSNTDRPHQNCRRQASTASSSSTSSAVKSRCKAGSVAPSPELVHRTSFASQSGTSVGGVTPAGNSLIPSFLGGRNERRTRSLERCFQHRVFSSSTSAAATIVPPARPPPVLPARIRSRSLEKNSHLSTTAAPKSVVGLNITNNNRLVGSSSNAAPVTPLLPARRAQVTPEVLATWCTFNEAFGGSRPKHSPDPPPPLTVSDEKDSPGSPVFEELFLPPPNRYSGPITAAPVASASTTSENKRNSSAGSCSPRSSPVPPSSQPETVLYGTREAPVLERHCVEGGEFIIAWLSHSNSSPSSSTTISHRAVPALPSEMQQPSSSSSSSPGNAVGSSANTPVGGSNRSFINKPARGWLHSDLVIVREGITYFVRYIGCLEVNTSMKSLDFDTRSQIAKECINLVCETAGLKAVDKKRKVDRRIQRILGDTPHMEHAGSDVALTISSGCLRISTLEGSTVVACHDMPNISFASGGDPDTLDFVAYVAKDNVHGRACYVLECGGGLAQDVITTIGQAFELRFKEYLKRTPRPSTETVTDSRESAAGANGGSSHQHPPPWSPDDPEYYNDLPGKVPPDVGGPPPVPPLPNYQAPAGTVASGTAQPAGQTGKKVARHQVDLSDNLIDLNADVSSLAASRADGASGAVAGSSVPPFADHEYVNGIVGSNGDFKTLSSTNKDPFDMHPFSTALPSPLLSPSVPGLGSSSSSSSGASSLAFSHKPITAVQQQRGGAMSKTLMNKTQSARAASHETQLSQEIWFHGPVSRKEAEDLLKHDGDFLVRESQGSHGQYVLTGMQSGNHKHLLLVDPEGVVRTKDRTFDSVSHLINYHRNNILPIISAESVLLLKRPVPRPHS